MTEGLSVQEQIQVITYKLQGRVPMAGLEVDTGAKEGQDVEDRVVTALSWNLADVRRTGSQGPQN